MYTRGRHNRSQPALAASAVHPRPAGHWQITGLCTSHLCHLKSAVRATACEPFDLCGCIQRALLATQGRPTRCINAKVQEQLRALQTCSSSKLGLVALVPPTVW
jgi:hypothetical protein